MAIIPKTVSLSCATLSGIQARGMTIEVDLFPGLPQFSIVGLTDTSVQESKERVRAAIKNAGYKFPDHRITVNMAPAGIRKEGTLVDLAIAIGILLRSDPHRPHADLTKMMIVGELSLDGRVRPVKGILAIAALAVEQGFSELLCSPENADEASVVKSLAVFSVITLEDALKYLYHAKELHRMPAKSFPPPVVDALHEIDQVYGQASAKRALQIAAAGGHHVFMIGPPGAGKTMMAKAFASLLPPMTEEEVLEVTTLYSVGGHLAPGAGFQTQRPFRQPHHTASTAAIVGGGSSPSPGEISLAHRGVLFLDEFPEFQQPVLEALRQPLEDRRITVSRSKEVVHYPANFLLVAAANPCPCGWKGDVDHACVCGPGQLNRYQKKCSGPLMDRIDLWLHVSRVDPKDLREHKFNARWDDLHRGVQIARSLQQLRFSSSALNGEMTNIEVERYCKLDPESAMFLDRAMKKFAFSARAYFRLLKVSRTIADLEQQENVQRSHLAEALQVRSLMD